MTAIATFLVENEKLVTGITAITAVIVSTISIFVAVRALSLQRAHNRKSLLPVAYFGVGDYENFLVVRLSNDGVGPMVVDKMSVLNASTKKEIGLAIIDHMPDGLEWETYTRDIRGRSLGAGKDLLLISLRGDPEDSTFRKARDSVRCELAKLIVKIEFHSVYDEKFVAERSLEWFAREK